MVERYRLADPDAPDNERSGNDHGNVSASERLNSSASASATEDDFPTAAGAEDGSAMTQDMALRSAVLTFTVNAIGAAILGVIYLN